MAGPSLEPIAAFANRIAELSAQHFTVIATPQPVEVRDVVYWSVLRAFGCTCHHRLWSEPPRRVPVYAEDVLCPLHGPTAVTRSSDDETHGDPGE